jgi:hypothetical protein
MSKLYWSDNDGNARDLIWARKKMDNIVIVIIVRVDRLKVCFCEGECVKEQSQHVKESVAYRP